MSRLYEALRKSEMENERKGVAVPVASREAEALIDLGSAPLELERAEAERTRVSSDSQLVAMTEPQSLAAEKFRVLVTRLGNLRAQRELKSLQVTSGVPEEGKTIVAANLAVTLARHTQSKVLLVEGDLHKPSLVSLLGLNQLQGIRQWWSDAKAPLSNYIRRIDDLPLWFLAAGGKCEQPAEVLQSGRLAEQFAQLSGWFDWIVVDSTPLLPMADANIWNRLVDGTLLIVREGITPVKTLKKGLESLDNAKLIGVVLNTASEFDRVNYYDQYYAATKPSSNGHSKEKVSEVRD
ncbi:MAG TPA: CpsD/CapB family tyrosine-protein kinase [Candidatus Acidoferrales bacterium]|nr:CpsD/CapB family tyrosine-protein kinase [Candidatus Acidoferrales bacterium]